VRIGSRSVLNIHLRVLDDYQPLVVIEDRVSIAPNVTLVASAAANNALLSELPGGVERLIRRSPVRIENDAWIGAGAIVLPGVRIGVGAIVGAGAVVTRAVEARTVVAGVPARRLRGAV
jgi:acetyltransferase-like isoleucine patch superfamily enzyme